MVVNLSGFSVRSVYHTYAVRNWWRSSYAKHNVRFFHFSNAKASRTPLTLNSLLFDVKEKYETSVTWRPKPLWVIIRISFTSEFHIYIEISSDSWVTWRILKVFRIFKIYFKESLVELNVECLTFDADNYENDKEYGY